VKSRSKLTQKRLQEVLRYDPNTGKWTRLQNHIRSDLIGKEAGYIITRGYRYIAVDRKTYRDSRLAFLYMTGKWPNGEAEHKDTNKLNCKWNNLREATRAQNTSNCGPRKTNKLGLKGVHRLNDGRFKAQIQTEKKKMSLGTFVCPLMASITYQLAALEHHGEFAYNPTGTVKKGELNSVKI